MQIQIVRVLALATGILSRISRRRIIMQAEIESYLREKNWGYRIEGSEVRLDRCPFCDGTSRRPFTINPETGNAICHKCDWRGGLTLLKRSQGDVVTQISENIQSPTRTVVVKPPRALADKYAKALQQSSDRMAMFCEWRKLKETTVRVGGQRTQHD